MVLCSRGSQLSVCWLIILGAYFLDSGMTMEEVVKTNDVTLKCVRLGRLNIIMQKLVLVLKYLSVLSKERQCGRN